MNSKYTGNSGIWGLGLVFVLGLVLSFAASNYITKQVIQITGQMASIFVEDTLLNRITTEDLFSKTKESQLRSTQFLEEISKIKKVALVKVWNTKGEIIYSTNRNLVGKSFPLNEELEQALAGRYIYELSSLTKDENKYERLRYTRLYEIYIPLRNSSGTKIIGAFELYWNADDLYKLFTAVFYTILLVLTIGFTLTYAGMYKSFKKLTTVINRKDLAITKFAKRLKNTRIDRDRCYTGTIQSLLAALDAKDNYTAGHSVRVADYSVKLARQLNLIESQIKLIEEAALFHDIGKIAIPEQILNKQGTSTPDEFHILQEHPIIGEQILNSGGVLEECSRIVRHHHERVDGNGYPDALVGEKIPLESQILAVADTYDALTSDRSYRKGLTVDAALGILEGLKGSQLNAELVDSFVLIIRGEQSSRR